MAVTPSRTRSCASLVPNHRLQAWHVCWSRPAICQTCRWAAGLRCCWLVGSGPACLSQPPVDPVSLLVAPLSCCVSCLFQSPPAFSPQALSCCCAALPQADVPAEVRQGLDVVACSRLEDVLAAAFDPPIRLAPQPLLARL